MQEECMIQLFKKSYIIVNIPGSTWNNNPTSTCLFRCWNTGHMSPEGCTLVGCGRDVQEDPRPMGLKGSVRYQMKSVNTEPVTNTAQEGKR